MNLYRHIGWMAAAVMLAVATTFVHGQDGRSAAEVEPAPQLRGLAVSTHFARRGGGWHVERLVPALKAAGFSAVRDEITWSSVEREKGVYRLPEVARDWLDAVAEAEVGVIVLLTYGNGIYDNPLDAEAFSRYAAFLVEELEDYPVVAWEIWNEPHNFEFQRRYGGEWNGSGDSPWVEEFAELVAVTADAIREVDPEATILTGGGTPPGNVHLMRRFPEAMRELDGLTEHPYPYRFPPETVPYGGESTNRRDDAKTADDDHSMTSMFRLLREHSEEHLGRPLPIWNTEFGYSTFNHHPEDAARGLYAGFSEQTQAMFHARAMVQAFGEGVANWTIYDLMDDGNNDRSAEDRFGLVRHASQDYEPKPALWTVRRVSQALGGEWQPAERGPAEMVVDADERLAETALQRSGRKVVTGPRVYWFEVGDAYVSFHWMAGWPDAAYQPAPVSFVGRQGVRLRPVEAVDVVTGEDLELTVREGEVRGLELRGSPIMVRWE